MEFNDYWSEERQKNSVDILFNGKCMEPCRVKHFREEDRYGAVSVVQGIEKGIWTVETDLGDYESFDSVEDLVRAGWVVD